MVWSQGNLTCYMQITKAQNSLRRISFLHSDNRKNLTCVFIRMCTKVTSSDMTSFVYIDDGKASSVKMAWKGKEMPPSKKKLSYLYWVIEESKDELQKMLDKPGNSHAVSSRNDFIVGLDWKHTMKLQENKHRCKRWSHHFADWELYK